MEAGLLSGSTERMRRLDAGHVDSVVLGREVLPQQTPSQILPGLSVWRTGDGHWQRHTLYSWCRGVAGSPRTALLKYLEMCGLARGGRECAFLKAILQSLVSRRKMPVVPARGVVIVSEPLRNHE